MITAPKIHTDLLWDLSFLFIGLGIIYFLAIFFYRNKHSATSGKVMQRKKELSPMISEFIFHEEDASKDEKSNYIKLKIEIRQLIKNDFNRRVLSEVLLDLQKDVSGDTQKRLFKLYQDLNLHTDAFAKLKSFRWEVVSKAITDLTQMQVSEAYGFVTKFINDKRATIRKQAEIATVTLKHEGLNFFLDTTKHKISEWQQLKLIDVIRNQQNYQPPRFKVWLTSTNSYVVLFALRLIKFYQQNDANASLIELIKHKNNQIKQEAIDCIKEFQVIEALPTLKTVFWKSTTDIKISILNAIGVLGTNNDIEFLQLIETKESNFYVKSKALSSINVISPESIMPTEGILDTTGYQIPDDLPIEKPTIDALIDKTENSSKTDKNVIQTSNINQNKKPKLPKTIEIKTENLEQKELFKDIKATAFDLDFLPIVVAKMPVKNDKRLNNTSYEHIKNLRVNFEEVLYSDHAKHTYAYFLKELNSLKIETDLEDANPEELKFLPIVVDIIDETAPDIVKPKKSESSSSLRAIDVQFEIIEKPPVKQVLEENTPFVSKEEHERLNNDIVKMISFKQYHNDTISNIDVTSEEILAGLTHEQIINNIEVIEPHFLTDSVENLEENLMDEPSNESHINLPFQQEMSPQDEEKFKKIINDLINFETKDEVDEIMEEFQNSSPFEFDNELIDIDFIPLVEEKQDDTNAIKEESSSSKNTNEQKKIKASIPKSIYTDELLKTSELHETSPEEATMQLLDDLSEMGDHRELPLLNEMLNKQKYRTVKERIQKMILRFSDDSFEPKTTNQDDTLDLKAFNVFEDLFRTCDTESKLILLDEILAIGDEDDVEFLERLLHDAAEEVQIKAAQVLEQLRIKLKENTIVESKHFEKNVQANTVHDVQKLPKSEKISKNEENPVEFTFLLEELEINPSPDADDIFDLDFEITVESAAPEQKNLNTNTNSEAFEKSIIGQLCHFSHKIIEKLYG